jgi:PST family polysaccharide transporter
LTNPASTNPASTNPLSNTKRLDRAFLGGMAWTAGAKWVTQLFTWISLFWAARLLSPSDFGMVEMAGLLTVIATVLAEFGVGTAVLQMRELPRPVLAQVHTIASLLGVLTFGLSVAAAPAVAAYFRNPALRDVVILNSTGFLIMAMQTVPQGLLQRDLDYRRLSIAEAAQALTQAILTVALAWLGYGYWSLVIASLAARAAMTGLLLWWQPVPFAWPRWREVAGPVGFGSQVAGARVANAIYSHIDAILIGRLLGDAALGVYRLALNLASAPAEKIGFLILRVTGPIFARVQDQPDQMRRYLFGVLEGLAFAILPLVCGMAALADLIVQVFFGEKWLEAVPAVRFLAVFMAIRSLTSVPQQALTALRETRFLLWLSIASFGLLPVLFYFLAPRGLGAISSAWLIATPVTSLPVFVLAARRLGAPLTLYAAHLFPAAFAAAVMSIGVLALAPYLEGFGWPGPARLAVLVAVGGAVYCGILWIGFRERVERFVALFRGMRG